MQPQPKLSRNHIQNATPNEIISKMRSGYPTDWNHWENKIKMPTLGRPSPKRKPLAVRPYLSKENVKRILYFRKTAAFGQALRWPIRPPEVASGRRSGEAVPKAETVCCAAISVEGKCETDIIAIIIVVLSQASNALIRSCRIFENAWFRALEGRTPWGFPGRGFRAKPQMLRFAHAECSKTLVLEF